MVSCHIPMVNLKVDVKKCEGGNITNSFEKWESITTDQYVLYTIKFGLTMKFAEVSVC